MLGEGFSLQEDDVPSSERGGLKHKIEVTSRLCLTFAFQKTGINGDAKLFTKSTKSGFFVKLVDKTFALCDIIVISAPVRRCS